MLVTVYKFDITSANPTDRQDSFHLEYIMDSIKIPKETERPGTWDMGYSRGSKRDYLHKLLGISRHPRKQKGLVCEIFRFD